MAKLFSGKLGKVLALVLALLGATTATVVILSSLGLGGPSITSVTPSSSSSALKKFESVEEFKSYLETASAAGGGFGLMSRNLTTLEAPVTAPTADLKQAVGSSEAAVPERVSETNVQVLGIDEPDIVKTDGTAIYLSSENYRVFAEPAIGMRFEENYVPPMPEAQTRIINAFPPAKLAVQGAIDKSGNLLLSDDLLVVFSNQTIYGYDVADPKNPTAKWHLDLNDRSTLAGARLYQGKIYLVTSLYVDTVTPCPIRPLSANGTALKIACTDIYRPVAEVPVDTTYTAMVVDPKNGEVERSVSFVGYSGSSVIYMSGPVIYATYSYYENYTGFFYNFLAEEAKDIIPAAVLEKIKKLQTYDISDTAKLTELSTILEKYQSSLSNDEQLKLDNELNNRMSDYVKQHQRELEKTGIVKIATSNLSVSATGSVPGRPLNQFSLDEYQGNLRIATTISGGFGFGGSSESVSDVYVLDPSLKTIGEVTGLGKGERIYSVRFLEDKGYVVTFKQIDPFYVLDLSNPKKPELKGELKIPGFSSYLHPISANRILGIGQENSQVKVSLFDVTSPANPVEIDKYNLTDYWTEVSSTHHAFLLDKKHQIFFLPGSHGGYVFSYQGDRLELKKAVSGIQAKRALYINDYLYIIGETKLTVLNESDWTEVNELEF